MTGGLRNLRFGLRLIGRQPGYAAVLIATLALGIGLTGAMFCILSGASRDLPFEEAERLIHLEHSLPEQGLEGLEVPIHDVLDWRERQTSFEELAAFHLGSADLAGAGQPPARHRVAHVTATMLPLVRVAPLHGRGFLPGEDRPDAPPVALLGYDLWRSRFSADPSVVGGSVRIDGVPTTVVGVMPKGFRFPLSEDLWLPLRLDPLREGRREGKRLEVFGRLRDGSTLEQARLDMDLLAERLAAEHPDTNLGVGVVLKPFVDEFVPPQIRALLRTMLAAVVGVLAVACVNVCNLLLARLALRGEEIAVRMAVGASRARIASQLLTETLVLAGIGFLAGLALAAGAIHVFRNAVAATGPPFWIQFRIDLSVLGFTAGAALAATLLSGWLPAARAAGAQVGRAGRPEALRLTGNRSGRLVQALLVSEVALTLALLSAAGVMVRTVVNLRTIDYGFPPEEIVTSRVEPSPRGYPSPDARRGFYESLRGRVEALPGVERAALVGHLPLVRSSPAPFAVEGVDLGGTGELPRASQVAVSPEFLEALDLRPVAGRPFDHGDREDGVPVALVDVDWAARHSPGESAVGRRIRLGDGRGREPWRTIVGTVPDLYPEAHGEADAGVIYVPVAQGDPKALYLVARAAGDPTVLAAPLRRELQALDPDLALGAVSTLSEVIRDGTWHYRVFGTVFLVFGATALFLAAVGLGGAISFSTSRRTHEIGVHRALGACSATIWWLVLRQVVIQLTAGVALGLALAVPLTRALRFILFGVEPWDGASLAVTVLVLVIACLGACAIPATRAVRVEPAVALRGC